MANEEHLNILKQGVGTWNEWRKNNSEIIPDLIYANLCDAHLLSFDFSHANLSGALLLHADLSYANMLHADLTNAYLYNSNFYSTKLVHATLCDADLNEADLVHTDLSHADLSHANLCEVNLFYTNLSDTNFSHTSMGRTVLCNVDLSEVKGLETIYHMSPSTIGIDTIYRSRGNIPYKFLLDAGVPKDDITYLLSLSGKAIDFYSCFISYSNQDKPFAERLHADLQAKGVRTWYAPEDLKIGKPFLLDIDEGIRLHDKLLVVLSENSISSGWVQHEVLSALAKEQGKAPWVLFPVRLDNTVMETNVPWATMIKQSRHIGDFTQWKDHDAYQQAFDRLLRDLKQGSGT